MNVLFVCKGNVGRSQMAEAICNASSNGRHEVISVGTQVDDANVGRTLAETESARNILTVLQELGIDATKQARKQVSPELVDWADVVVVMAERDAVPAYVEQNPKSVYWSVRDPFEQSLAFTREVRDQIAGLIRGLTS